jgi:RNA polymerase sigma factor (sigma-70 family)
MAPSPLSAESELAPSLDPMEAEARDHPWSRRRLWTDLRDAPDETLLAGMAAGDQRAGAAFVARHERRVFGIALAITMNRATAEDVAQEALIRAWRHAAVFDPQRSTASTWLSTITRNLAIDALRIQRSVPVDPGDAVWLCAEGGREQGVGQGAPEARAVHADAIDRVRIALLSVPEDQRRALIRSAFYGQSASEIAAAENVPLGTAKGRVRLALGRVRDLLGGDE